MSYQDFEWLVWSFCFILTLLNTHNHTKSKHRKKSIYLPGAPASSAREIRAVELSHTRIIGKHDGNFSSLFWDVIWISELMIDTELWIQSTFYLHQCSYSQTKGMNKEMKLVSDSLNFSFQRSWHIFKITQKPKIWLLFTTNVVT